MKNISYLTIKILTTICTLYLVYILSIHPYFVRQKLLLISSEMVDLFTEDTKLKGITNNNIWLDGSEYFCPEKINIVQECDKNRIKYIEYIKSLPKNVAFYKCGNGVLVRERARNVFGIWYFYYYEFYVDSPGIDQGKIKNPDNTLKWIGYDQNLNEGVWEPCYPWENSGNNDVRWILPLKK